MVISCRSWWLIKNVMHFQSPNLLALFALHKQSFIKNQQIRNKLMLMYSSQYFPCKVNEFTCGKHNFPQVNSFLLLYTVVKPSYGYSFMSFLRCKVKFWNSDSSKCNLFFTNILSNDGSYTIHSLGSSYLFKTISRVISFLNAVYIWQLLCFT